MSTLIYFFYETDDSEDMIFFADNKINDDRNWKEKNLSIHFKIISFEISDSLLRRINCSISKY